MAKHYKTKLHRTSHTRKHILTYFLETTEPPNTCFFLSLAICDSSFEISRSTLCMFCSSSSLLVLTAGSASSSTYCRSGAGSGRSPPPGASSRSAPGNMYSTLPQNCMIQSHKMPLQEPLVNIQGILCSSDQ